MYHCRPLQRLHLDVRLPDRWRYTARPTAGVQNRRTARMSIPCNSGRRLAELHDTMRVPLTYDPSGVCPALHSALGHAFFPSRNPCTVES